MIVVALWRTLPSSVSLFESSADLARYKPNSEGWTKQLWFAAAFVIGFIPGLAERYIISIWRRGNVKQIEGRALEQTKTIPLELIEGIDADIRAKLEDFNLFDVQNLATANPIMLFVETPYGIYQSIDWVAQAQLATSVGISRYLVLRNFAIRNLFDLERLFIDEKPESARTLKGKISNILLYSTEERNPSPNENSNIEDATALVRLMIDDLAFLRLRQIWKTIEKNFLDPKTETNADPKTEAGDVPTGAQS